jgi:acyl-homoserine-lactone acylase
MLLILLAGLPLLAACQRDQVPAAESAPSAVPSEARFETEIRWTSYGIPHVQAGDWGGLGYGFAYATARDAVCVIARELVTVNGRMSRFFGASDEHLASDIFHRAILQSERMQAYNELESENGSAFSDGYVAGYNRYLRDHAGRLPAACNEAPWVRPMRRDDVARMAIGVGIRYGLGRVQREMAAARPPQADEPALALGHTDFSRPRGYGSNAVALGRTVTASGRGILFGNPHYPWEGPSRFHLIHTTIPGELDVMGASLLTTPRVAIGFNRDVAWSHTVSTALRATFYALELHPEDPLQYRYGDGYQQMLAVEVGVEAEQGNGRSPHTVYFTHYGPVVQSEQLPWTNERAFAVRDANLANGQNGVTYDTLARARSVADVEAAISLQGVAWTNTVAADRHGGAFYADISATPNVDAELLERCRVMPGEVPARVVVLDGSRPDCEWRDDPRSRVPGNLPAADMPRLHRDDYVANSNDSYWLSNPQQPLEGFSPIIGNEREARSLRTRAGLVFINELLASGHRFTPEDMQEMLYHHRNYGAELLLDDLLGLCGDDMPPVQLEAGPVELRDACEVLDKWDRRMAVDSRGGHLWREFWRDARDIEGVYAVPFDVTDPVHTPRGLAVSEPAVRDALLAALAGATQRLQEAGIALDARLGDIQYRALNGDRIPVPGGEGWAGMWSMIIARLESGQGYTPIIHGNSYVQVISWDEAGELDARGILTYSQSPEPDSPHSTDQTKLYAEGGWLTLPFTDAEIAADPALETLLLRE